MLSLTSLFGNDAPILRETNFQALLLTALLPSLGIALASPVLDSLIRPFGASSGTIGWMISVHTAPAIVMIPLAGVLADRYGRKTVLVPSIVLFGLGGTLIALTTDFRVALFLRFIQGIGFAGVSPIIITSIGDLYTGRKEETGQALRFTISGFSGALFPVIAGVLVVFSWQYPFLLYAISFPIAVGVYIWFDEPTDHPSTVLTDGGGMTCYIHALLRLTKQQRVLAMVIARGLMPVVFIGFVTYNSLIVTRLLNGTPVEAGILAAVVYMSFAVSASQAGRITALFERRFSPIIAANVSLVLGFTVVLFAPGIVVATVGTVSLGIGFGIVGAIYRSIITGLPPAGLRAGLVSLSEAADRVMATVTPLFMGGIIAVVSSSVGFGPAVQLAGLVVAVVGGGGGIVCLLVASASEPVSKDQFRRMSRD